MEFSRVFNKILSVVSFLLLLIVWYWFIYSYYNNNYKLSLFLFLVYFIYLQIQQLKQQYNINRKLDVLYEKILEVKK